MISVAAASNPLNRANYAVPSALDVTTARFGIITNVTSKENGGPRTIQAARGRLGADFKVGLGFKSKPARLGLEGCAVKLV